MEMIRTIDDVYRQITIFQGEVETMRPLPVVFDHVKLSEEVGELAERLLEMSGYKTNDLHAGYLLDEAKAEAVDIMIMAMVIAFKLGTSRVELVEKAIDKLERWEFNHIIPLREKILNERSK